MSSEIINQLQTDAKDLTILYVEDEEELRNGLQKYLEKFFKTVKSCKDGLEGLEEYQKSKYDLVVSDINMPNMDGISMSKSIKALDQEQHILIVSAYNDMENYVESIKIGIDGYILKPIDFMQLNQALLKIVKQINLQKLKESYKEYLEESVEAKVKEIKKQYITDNLTKLGNKTLLDQKLSTVQDQTLILLDIDNFRLINYNFGYLIGDQLLIKTAEILKKFQFEGFNLFRLQSDEFVYLSNGVKLDEAKNISKAIKQYFENNTIVINDIEIVVNLSIAIDYGKNTDLLKNTALTIDALKEKGLKKIAIHEDNIEYEKKQQNNLFWIKKLKSCLAEDQLVPFFQPIFNLQTKTIDKYEALARIILEDDKIITPNNFIEPATLTGMSTDITKIMIDKSFSFIQNNPKKSISLNITQEDFQKGYLSYFLENKRDQYKIDRGQIILEILESISVDTAASSLDQIEDLKEMGYKISIDDFGTEMSNFSRLLNLNPDYIKIDGSFIKNIDTSENSLEIVKSIVEFSHKTNAKVIAEYVHNKSVFDVIIGLGVDFAQGYYIDKPLPQSEIVVNKSFYKG